MYEYRQTERSAILGLFSRQYAAGFVTTCEFDETDDGEPYTCFYGLLRERPPFMTIARQIVDGKAWWAALDIEGRVLCKDRSVFALIEDIERRGSLLQLVRIA